MARCETTHVYNRNIGHALRCLAILAPFGCTPLPRGTTLPTIPRDQLENAFAQCEAAELIEEPPGQYYALACDRVAIYRCDDTVESEEPQCTRIAAGEPATVLPADRSGKTREHLAYQLFEYGREMDKEGRKLEACDLFSESDDLWRTFGSALNLADCEASDGHAETAWGLYNAADLIAENAGDDRLAKTARNSASSILATRLCALNITMPGPSVAGSRVYIGDRAMPPAPTIRTAVAPATIDVVVRAPLGQPFRRTVRCPAGASISIVVPAYRPRVAAPVTPVSQSPAPVSQGPGPVSQSPTPPPGELFMPEPAQPTSHTASP